MVAGAEMVAWEVEEVAEEATASSVEKVVILPVNALSGHKFISSPLLLCYYLK